MSTPQLHRCIDVFTRRVALLEHAHRGIQIGEEQQVGDEARAVPTWDGGLPEALRERLRGVDDRCVRCNRVHKLNELHDLSGVEEVKTNHPIWSFGGHSHVDDGKRRGIRREDGFWLQHFVQFREHLLLELELLGNRLEREIAAR